MQTNARFTVIVQLAAMRKTVLLLHTYYKYLIYVEPDDHLLRL